MTKLQIIVRALTCAAFVLVFTTFAQAQATRTWVSGVGDDVNPCSRTAPCKTFAGAISKTAAGGEINALDPGGFGTLTITKAMTIDGGETHASILSALAPSGVNVNISAAATDGRRVTLRRLSINGVGTGTRGVTITAANRVFIEDSYIQNVTGECVRADLAETGAYVSVKNTNLQNCSIGVRLSTTSGFSVGYMERVRIEKMSSHGVSLGAGANMKVRDSAVVFNGGDGFVITNTVTNATLSLEHTYISSNSTGVRNGATGSIVDLSNTTIFTNGTGLASSSGAAGGGINSHGNNQIADNTSPGTVPNPVGQQ